MEAPQTAAILSLFQRLLCEVAGASGRRLLERVVLLPVMEAELAVLEGKIAEVAVLAAIQVMAEMVVVELAVEVQVLLALAAVVVAAMGLVLCTTLDPDVVSAAWEHGLVLAAVLVCMVKAQMALVEHASCPAPISPKWGVVAVAPAVRLLRQHLQQATVAVSATISVAVSPVFLVAVALEPPLAA